MDPCLDIYPESISGMMMMAGTPKPSQSRIGDVLEKFEFV